MPRVLLAQHTNWINTARMPAMLARAGIRCDLVDPGGTYAAASSHVDRRTAIPDGIDAVASEVLRVAERYDRVIPCTDDLVLAMVRIGGEDAGRVLGMSSACLTTLCTKTLFPAAARASGLRVADSEVAESASEAAEAATRLGGRVVVKGRWGAGGASVRIADSPEAAAAAAEQLKAPVLVEEFVDGELANAPCLFESGRLVAAMTARKLELVRANGPSAVNGFFPVEERIGSALERMGEAFGLSGFVSADLFLADDGDPVILEVNPRPVHQLGIGASVGADMGRALRDVLEKRWDGTPRLANRARTVQLFPQSLMRRREMEGPGPGTRSWLKTPGRFADVPWGDLGLLARFFREFAPMR